jgi:hypothetical protein
MSKSDDAAKVSLASIPPPKQGTAQMILDAFAAAGFGQPQQAAALANAIAESNLDPNAHAAGEVSFGLFMLNRRGSLSTGHTPDELKDPKVNIGLVVAEAKKHPAFTTAKSSDDAVEAFVQMIMRPANMAAETAKRQAIARKLLGA